MIEAKSVKTNETEIMKDLLGRQVNLEQRYDVFMLKTITKWLQKNCA